MRLIDADDLLKYMETTEIKQYMDELNKGNDNYSSTALYGYIKEMPTAYDVDKVVEQLEEYAHGSICKTHEHGCPYLINDDVSCENCGAIGALEIVKSGGIE